MLAWPWTLRKRGVLGINARNHRLVQAMNPRSRFPLVDDKSETKQALERWDIPTPAGIAVIRAHHEIAHFEKVIGERQRFVVKPCRGSGGKGIVVITGRAGDAFVKPSGKRVNRDRLRTHLANTLSGLYSLTGRPDSILVEECIEFSNVFDRFAYSGVPDLRIVVYRGYPTLAMMRLPTRRADGKANLHQGALGAGIDLASGRAIHACSGNAPCHHHPDTGALIRELIVPQWRKCMHLAARCYEMCGLGYFGADIVLDAERGPLVLELNARPGLAIQLATGQGLAARLAAIDRLPHDPLPSADERAALMTKG